MTTSVRLLPLLALSACAIAGDAGTSTQQALGGTASVSLQSASGTISQSSATTWALAKTGSVDTGSQTISWTITATQGSTVGGQLHLTGTLNVTNTGTGGATIGNIVVNLQARSGNTWTTRSSDVNDATNGDAATTAYIYKQASSEFRASFSENSASGSLQFTDANTNTLFSLVPEVTIPAGATVPLRFDAAFDNNVLHLANGTAVRAEVIVSFGNHGPHGATGANIDINGNGAIDPDEAYVRSVPARLPFNVPAQTSSTGTVAISDALSDIASTGTVTLSNASFNLGATSGSVSVHYDAGTDGGDVTNCAHLTDGGALNLQACNTQSVTGTGTGGGSGSGSGSGGCTDGAAGCGWSNGDLTTYSQVTWPDDTTARSIAINNFNTVYAASFGVMEVGIPGTAGFSMRFDSGTAVLTYVPANGTAAALTADLFDPTTSSSGTFGGEVVALQLNVDFSGYTAGTTGFPFGSLTVCGLATTALDNLTVSQVLADANIALGGGTTVASIADLNTLAQSLNTAFLGGVPSTFAQQHLVHGSCP